MPTSAQHSASLGHTSACLCHAPPRRLLALTSAGIFRVPDQRELPCKSHLNPSRCLPHPSVRHTAPRPPYSSARSFFWAGARPGVGKLVPLKPPSPCLSSSFSTLPWGPPFCSLTHKLTQDPVFGGRYAVPPIQQVLSEHFVQCRFVIMWMRCRGNLTSFYP